MKTAGVMTIAAILAGPGPAMGQTFDLPQGCEAFVTVQGKDCTVSHMFTCAQDPEGHTRRADLDEEMITYVGRVDSEAQWIESFHLASGHVERLERNPADPASLTELLATERDTWDFVTQSAEIGPTRYTGEDRLTGQSVVIDGVTLLRTEYEITARDGDGEECGAGRGANSSIPTGASFCRASANTPPPTTVSRPTDAPSSSSFPASRAFSPSTRNTAAAS